MPDEFDFQSPEEVSLDDYLQVTDDGGDISPEFMDDLAVPEESVMVSVPVKDKDASELAADVEDLFLTLLEGGRRDTILQLVGEVVRGGNTSEVFGGDLDTANFRVAYAKGSGYNPALKWYPKFISVLGAGIGVQNGELSLKISASQYRKMVYPFLADFKEALIEESPLVELVYVLGRRLNLLAVDKGLKRYAPKQVAHDPSDLEVGGLTFRELQIQDTEDALSGEDPLSFLDETDIGEAMESPGEAMVSMVDLSNKAISDFFVGRNTPLDVIERQLLQDGFPKSRANEIVSIVRYVRLNASLDAKVTPKSTGGTANFKY